MCAGITTYNALRNSGARVGDVVAILGIGGLGHLEFSLQPRWVLGPLLLQEEKTKRRWLENLVPFITLIANLKMLPKNLSSLASSENGGAAEGADGAKVILATVPSGKAMSAVLGGLSVNGKLIVIGASDEIIEVPPNLIHIRT